MKTGRIYFIYSLYSDIACSYLFMYTRKLQDIVFQNMTYSTEKKRMNASLYPELLKMPE